MHGSGGGQPDFEINVNSRHPVMRVVLPLKLRSTTDGKNLHRNDRNQLLLQRSTGAGDGRLAKTGRVVGLDAALLTSDELVTSVAVETELNAGDFPHKSDMIELASRFPLLDINDAVIEAVEAYIANHVMPSDPGGDAFPFGFCFIPSVRLPGHLELPTHCER